MSKNYLLLFLLASFANITIAQRLKTEDFNYTSGQLTNLNGGANVSGGSWISLSGTVKPLQVNTGDLAYPNYFTSPSGPGTHLHLDTSRSNAEDVYSSFQIVKENTIYTSFLLKVNSLNNLGAHDSINAEYFACLFSSNPNSKSVCRLYMRQGNINKKAEEAASFNLGISARGYTSNPVDWVDTDLLPNTIYLITMAYQIVPGETNDVAKLWINQPFADTEPTANASSTMTAEAGPEPINISRFSLRQAYSGAIKAGTPQCDIDAIKISSSWLDGTLPLQLLNISVFNNNGYAKLGWQTCNEINMNHFEVQKSNDAINFSTIATVAAKNALCNTAYSYSDEKTLPATTYYRIKIVDNDGKATYSAIVFINGKASLNLSIFPNPVANNLVLSHAQAGNNALIQIISLNGKDILRQALQPGSIQTSIDASTFSKGNYIVVYINDNTKQSIKFVKQ